MVPESADVLLLRLSAVKGSIFWLGAVQGRPNAKPFVVMSSRSSAGSTESCRIVGELHIISGGKKISAVLAVDESDINLNEVRNASDLSEELHTLLKTSVQDLFGANASISGYDDFNSMSSIYL
ncbi:MAG: hypothetical protein QXN59_00700 [Candidatus Micrarchaeaceae archaeon]